MGWLLRHNWLWVLLAFALGAVITWFLVRRGPGAYRDTGRRPRPVAQQAPQPVRRREPVLVGAGGGGSVADDREPRSEGPDAPTAERQPAAGDRQPLDDERPLTGGGDKPMGGGDKPAQGGGDKPAGGGGDKPVTMDRRPAADGPVSIDVSRHRVGDEDEPRADHWREPMHDTWETVSTEQDRPDRRSRAEQRSAPVGPVPTAEPVPEFSERMDNGTTPPEHGVPAHEPDAVLLDGVMGQPAGADDVPPGRYGEGSADALPHRSAPDGYTIKGNEHSKFFHTPDSPSYGRTRPQVWFRTEKDAERAGFTKYVREPRAGGN